MMKKLTVVAIVAALLLAAGCERKMDSTDTVPQPPRTGAVPVSVKALIGDETVTLTWSVSGSSDILRFRIYASENDTLRYLLRDSSTVNSATISGLQVNRRYYFKVAALMNSGVEWYPSAPVTAYLGRLAVRLDDGAEYTRSRSVQVFVNAPDGASDIMLSERADLLGAAWQEFDSPVEFALSDGDGAKTVYARLQFADGSESGLTLSDGIILDTYAHIEEVRFTPTASSFIAGENILFEADAGETGGKATVSFGDYGSLPLNDLGNDGDLTAGDGTYSFLYTVPLSIRADEEVVSAQFTDAAGNVASSATAAQRLTIRDVNVPDPVMLIAQIEGDEDVVELNWSASDDTDFLAYRIYKRLDNAAVSTTDTLVAIVSSRSTTSRSYYFQDGDSGHTVYFRIWVYDRYGAVSQASNVASVQAP